MPDETSEFLQGFDKGAAVATDAIAEQLAEQAAAREDAEIRAMGGDPERIRYIRERHPNGMNVEEWQALEEFFDGKDAA